MPSKRKRHETVRAIVRNARRKNKQMHRMITPVVLIQYYVDRRTSAGPGERVSYSICIRELIEMVPLIP